MFNPYQPYLNNQQIIKVNGPAGASAYQMLPNCSALLLDETAPRLFLKTTDGAGYPTIEAFKLEKYIEEQPVNISDLMERISKLEEIVNAKSNTSNAKRKQASESE